MKGLKNKILSCVLAGVMGFTVSVTVEKHETIKAYAATGEQFLSEVALVYEDSVDDAKEVVAGTPWKIYEKDLNRDSDPVFSNGVYLAYQTSTNVEDAITDLRVMDMYGGFSISNYERTLADSRSTYQNMATQLRVVAAEFKDKLEAGDAMAQLAYRQMNYYQDKRTTGGTETNMLMGEFFLNMPLDDQIVQMMMEGNSVVFNNLVALLAIGISGVGEQTLSSRIAEKYAIKDTLTHEEYHESAVALSAALETTRAKLLRYDTLSEEYDLTDENMPEEEFSFMSNYGSIAMLMDSLTYGETKLGEFIRKGTWTIQDLYPLAAALTEGQNVLVEWGQLETILKYNAPSKPIEELNAMLDEAEKELKDSNGVLQPIDVYTGVDRSIFKGSFAMTNAAERQQAITGKTWDMNSAREASKGFYIASYVLTGVGVVLAIAATVIVVKDLVVHAAAQAAEVAYWTQGVGTWFEMDQMKTAADAFTAKWAPFAQGFAVAAFAILIIAFGLKSVSLWYNYYNPDYTEIPNTIVDVRETDLGDKYIKYTAAKVINGEDEEQNADFNAYEGREWNALYYTKDATAGYCLTPNFVLRENNNTVAKRHQGVSMFGETNAYNLNSHVYKAGAPGLYLTVRYSTTKKAATDIPTVVGSMLGAGWYYALTGFGGFGLGAVGMAMWHQFGKKKKEEETVPEPSQEE